jgi:hypothetical protein
MYNILGLVGGLVLVVVSILGISALWETAVKPFLQASITLMVLCMGFGMAAWATGSILNNLRERKERKAANQAQPTETASP